MKKINRKNKNKKRLIIIVLVVLVIILISSYLVYKNYDKKYKVSVILKNDLTVEINSEVNLHSFINEVKNGEIVTEDIPIDTSKLGNKELELSIKNKQDKIEKYSYKIKIVDTKNPEIIGKEKITAYINSEIDLLDDVTVSDNSLEELKAIVSGEYDLTKVGDYKLKYVAKDSSGNKTEYDFILSVIDDPNNRTFTTSKGFSGKVINGVTYIDGVLIANKSYSLPSNYGSGLTSETLAAFNKMKNAAVEEGLNLYISSGYRSYADQKYIYNNYVLRDGQEEADTYSARAGHSEHQTGLAFDLNTIDSSFAMTAEGIWVADNCYKYGLILRYPLGKENITGYMYESWHLRYVGIDLATKLYNGGNWITLEEYYGIDSKYS